MDPRALIDTGVLVAAFHQRDTYHRQALPIVLAADEATIPPLYLTDFILAETLNFLTRKGGSRPAREVLDRLEASAGFVVERVPDTVYTRAKNDVFRTYDGLSFVDALTVAYMQARGLSHIYTFDKGFEVVPKLRRIDRVTK